MRHTPLLGDASRHELRAALGLFGSIGSRAGQLAWAVLLVTITTVGCAPPPSPAAPAARPAVIRSAVEPVPLASARPAPGPDIRLEATLDEAAKQRPFSGVVLIAAGARIVAHRSAGFADSARSQPITEASRFVIGSLSKQITAALVMREVEAGRVRLEDPLTRYLPLTVPEAVEVRHLLNHTSGIKALDQPLAREPGTAFEYSNLGYDLLALLVERTSGQSFPEAVKRLFASCGIFGPGTLDATNQSSLVVGFGESAEGALTPLPLPIEVKEHPASGGLVASAGEFLEWTRCLESGRAVSSSSFQSMATASTTRNHRWSVLGYGFGLQTLESDGLLELSHSGYVPGFVSTLLMYPKLCVTVVILENLATPASDMPRAFAPHDLIRSSVREALLSTQAGEVRCAATASSAQ